MYSKKEEVLCLPISQISIIKLQKNIIPILQDRYHKLLQKTLLPDPSTPFIKNQPINPLPQQPHFQHPDLSIELRQKLLSASTVTIAGFEQRYDRRRSRAIRSQPQEPQQPQQ